MKPLSILLFPILLLVSACSLFAGDAWFADTRPGAAAFSRFVTAPNGSSGWVASTGQNFIETFDHQIPLLVVIHGNWMTRTEAKAYGKAFHLLSRNTGPHRLLIWSWPSEKLNCRTRRDAQIKASRADAQSEHLIALLRSLPDNSKVSLVGFSFGSKLICNTLQHYVERINEEPEHVLRIRTVLLAAAMDQASLQPGRKYSDALLATEKMLVHVNRLDSTLRFYPLLYGCGGPEAVGKEGVNRFGLSAESLAKLKSVNVSRMIGKEHGFMNSLTAFFACRDDFFTYALFQGK